MTRKKIDWESIKKEWEENKLSTLKIGKKYGCSHTAINKKAKKEGWEKDLSSKVQKKIKEKILLGENEGQTEEEQIDEAVQKGVEITNEHLALLEDYTKSLKNLFKPIKSKEFIKELDEKIKDAPIKDLKGYIKIVMDLSLSVIKIERELRNIQPQDDTNESTLQIKFLK